MPKSVFLAWTEPVDEASESEFNAWYSGTHVPEVQAAIPAVTGAHRYRVADLPGAPAPTHRYLCIWEADTDDVASVAAALQVAAADGKLSMTPAMDVTNNPPVLHWLQAVAE